MGPKDPEFIGNKHHSLITYSATDYR